MSQSALSSHAELVAAIDSAWEDLHSFLQSLTSSHDSARDDKGWGVKDHVTHMTVWEDSVAVLFRGGLRHKALGIEEAFYRASSFDQINEVIRERFKAVPLTRAIRQLEQVHGELVTRVKALSDVDLRTAVRDFFPQAPRADDRPMMTFIYDNTADHFIEHLRWMRELIKGAA
jgi:hypothetical protein